MEKYGMFRLKGWYWMKFDARRKIFRGIARDAFEAARDRHIDRMAHRHVPESDMRCESLKIVDFCKSGRGTPYEKRIMEGGRYLWLASPVHGLNDYNKSIFAENTPRNRRKAELINALAAK